MPTVFPSAIDDLLNPGPTDLENGVEALYHDVQHANLNDAVEALETAVGIDNSDDPASLDYRVRNGASIRKTLTVTSDTIAANATDATKTLAIGKGCFIVKMETDHPAWVRLYSSQAAQTADAARPQTTDPTGEHGVLLEVITTEANLALDLSPAAMCYNLEAVPDTNLPVTITNLDNVSREILVTVTVIPLEG